MDIEHTVGKVKVKFCTKCGKKYTTTGSFGVCGICTLERNMRLWCIKK